MKLVNDNNNVILLSLSVVVSDTYQSLFAHKFTYIECYEKEVKE